MRGGYKGYYNGCALDSSYEYIYCKILENKGIKYGVHEQNYQLDGRQYTPDFFLYDSNNELYEIVEIRGHRLNLEERLIDTKELRDILKISVKLITEKDLKAMCNNCGLSYNKLKTEWRTSPNTFKNKNEGEFNAMYGKKQSDEQKRKSSIKGVDRFNGENRDKYLSLCTNKMIEFNRNNNFEHAKKPRAKRTNIYCLYCGKEIEVTESVAKHQKYCSLTCANLHGTGLILATKAVKDNKIKKDVIIKEIALDCASEFKNEILTMKLNEIQTSVAISEMINRIKEATGVFDMRTITMAVCNTKSRKEFILKLREFIIQ